jgi:hypothetical protein
VTAFHGLLSSILLDDDAHRLSRFSRDPLDPRIQKRVDTLVREQAAKSFGYIRVFSMQQPVIAFDHRHLAAESAHRLGQLYSDVAAADHK